MELNTFKISLSIQDKMLENIHIIKLLQDNDFKKVVENLTGEKINNIGDFLKYRILNFIKNTKYIKNVIENDNEKFINIVKNLENLEIRDKLIDNIIEFQKNKNNEAISLKSPEDWNDFLLKIKSKDSLILNIINPFNNVTTSISMSLEKIENTSFLTTNTTKLYNKDLNDCFHVFLNKSTEKRVGFNIFDKEKERSLILEFTLAHELAHASYSQILRNKTNNEKEINSDMVAIIKTIKNNNFNVYDSKNLCNFLLKYRSKQATYKERQDGSGYMTGVPYNRTHFTEEAILNFKNIINEDNLDYIKNIKDIEISTFCELFYENSKKLNNYVEKDFNLSERQLVVETILNDPKFFITIKDDYDSSHASGLSRFSYNSFEVMKKNYPATKEYIDKINRNIMSVAKTNRSAFNDLYIIYNLRTNFKKYIEKTENVPINQNLFNDIKEIFNNYKINKDNLKIDVDINTTSKELRNKISLN